MAPDKERQSRAELRTVKENGWSDRWSVRPLPPVTISVISWAGLGWARPGYNTATTAWIDIAVISRGGLGGFPS